MKPVEPILAENVCITNYLILHFLKICFSSQKGKLNKSTLTNIDGHLGKGHSADWLISTTFLTVKQRIIHFLNIKAGTEIGLTN